MFKRKNLIAPVAVTLVAVALLSLPSGAAMRIKHANGGLFAPFLAPSTPSVNCLARPWTPSCPAAGCSGTWGISASKTSALQAQNLQAAALLDENNQLRAQLGWQKQSPWKLKLAGVILRDPANWWRTVEIDLGSRDGVRENLPVLTRDGLAGRVSSVGYARSQVVLVGDPVCRVSARVNNAKQDMGIVTTAGPLDSSLVNSDLSLRRRETGIRPESRHQRRGRDFPAGNSRGPDCGFEPGREWTLHRGARETFRQPRSIGRSVGYISMRK